MDEKYKKYTIILICLFGGNATNQELSVYFDDFEAMKCFSLLNEKINLLTKTNAPISMSLVCRNESEEIVRYGFSNIIQICHNIPNYKNVEQDES